MNKGIQFKELEESKTFSTHSTLHSLSTIIFYLSILVFIIGFGFRDTPTPFGWYQQFMPNLNGASITDITFTDSLNGYAVSSLRTAGDSSYILKTTDSGNTWNLKFANNKAFVRIEFINSTTGFTNSFTTIFKTTNSGENWFSINLPSIFGDDMFVLSNDTIWLAMSESLTGGVYRTTNGGINWFQQASFASNPDHIYMFNSRIGFVAKANNYIRRTIDGGQSWNVVVNGEGFKDMNFIDSLNGWECSGQIDSIKHTTDGGLNWVKQILPPEGIPLLLSRMQRITFVTKDTIWGIGGTYSWTGYNYKGIIYKTTNGGVNWGYQLPDTNTINIGLYYYTKFVNKLNGWAYASNGTGVHTTTGGDTVWYFGIQQTSKNIPKQYELKQNYPNPFNPRTVIPYRLKKPGYVKLIAYDILGRDVSKMVNQKQEAGEYEVDFMGKFSASGIYFYRMIVIDDKTNEIFSETKKMLLIK